MSRFRMLVGVLVAIGFAAVMVAHDQAGQDGRSGLPVAPSAELHRDAIDMVGMSGAPVAPVLAGIPRALKTEPVAICDGNGVSGKRAELVYAGAGSAEDGYRQFLTSFRVWANEVDAMFADSAARSGGSRHVRYVTDGACRVAVARVDLPRNAFGDPTGLVSALRGKGYGLANRRYLVFADTSEWCARSKGPGGADDRPGADNAHNGGPGWVLLGRACWGGRPAAHGLVHTLGAVLPSAPHAGPDGHCKDGMDLMCPAGPPPAAAGQAEDAVPCPAEGETPPLDCGNDDYFSASPEPDGWLATHWNVADSDFLIKNR